MGMGIFNPASSIVWRRYTREELPWGEAYLKAALDRALSLRDGESFGRLVWSEADDIPGLIVDRFGDVLVAQAVTLAVDQQVSLISELLIKRLNPREILWRNDAPVRRLEGLESQSFTVSGKVLEPFWANIDGVEYYLDLQESQKTGFYLDQRQEHQRIAKLASGRKVLDAFCNQGAFALQCAKAGAKEVVAIDISGEAIERAQQNARHNQLSVEFITANLFDWFSANPQLRYDLIILDPPSFARNRQAVAGALRGYGELNRRALSMLNKGGILATYSCSQNISRDDFNQVLDKAARDSGRTVCLVRESGQPEDHPIRLNFPESAYLKGSILRVDDGASVVSPK
jgi:23S rRNA (cytosine1962-C5)-methyltransferase